jgi:hypothetical protein
LRGQVFKFPGNIIHVARGRDEDRNGLAMVLRGLRRRRRARLGGRAGHRRRSASGHRASSRPDGLQYQRDAVGERACGYIDGLEPEAAICLLVELLEDERVLEADPPGGGGLNEALVR